MDTKEIVSLAAFGLKGNKSSFSFKKGGHVPLVASIIIATPHVSVST